MMHASKRSLRREGGVYRQFRKIPLAAAVALAFAAPAWAQEAAPPPPPQKDKEARTLDTVTVSAQ